MERPTPVDVSISDLALRLQETHPRVPVLVRADAEDQEPVLLDDLAAEPFQLLELTPAVRIVEGPKGQEHVPSAIIPPDVPVPAVRGRDDGRGDLLDREGLLRRFLDRPNLL